MEPTWKQAIVFHIIAQIIGEAHRQSRGYVTVHEMATRLAHDRQAKPLIEHARKQLGEPRSPERMAGNMVAWFSQRITVGESQWGRAVARTKIDDQWAYKPVLAESGA